jgi:hypothetical protein
MIRIRFNSVDAKKRALGRLAGRYPFKSRATGEMLVPAEALGFLATENIPFEVEGPATSEPITRAEPTDPTEPPAAVPPLENGDRLSRAEFERRYDAMSDLKKAEFIEGQVYVGSRVRHRQHSRPHGQLATWLGTYAAGTPVLEAGNSGGIRLDLDNMPRPDVYLMIEPQFGGQARISADDYVEGAPELIAEVAASSVSIDLGKKLHV